MPDVNPNWWQDAIYNSIVGPGGSIQTGLNNTKAQLTGAAQKTFSDLGVTQTGDIFGDPSQVKYGIDDNVDVTNPFSRAALLKTSYNQQQAGNKNSYAARGMTNAGALQNAQNQAATGFLQGQDSITKQAGSFVGDAIAQWIAAQNSAGSQSSAAAGDAFNRNRDLPGSPYYVPPPAPEQAPPPPPPPAAARSDSPPTNVASLTPEQQEWIRKLPGGSSVPGLPKAGYQFVQDSGTRTGLSYKVVTKDGKRYRFYENGDKVIA